MKSLVQFLTILVVGMVLSCAMNSLLMALNIMPKVATATIGANVNGPPSGNEGVKRKDFLYPDFNVSDKGPPQPNGYAVHVTDTDAENNQLEFPTSW